MSLLVFAAGCLRPDESAPPDPWVMELVAADPILGGGPALEGIFLTDPSRLLAGEPYARRVYLTQKRDQHDREAAAWIRCNVPAELGREVLPFFRSRAGNALAAAQATTLALFPWQGADFPERSAQYFAERANVGDQAAVRLEEHRRAQCEGRSGSPSDVARTIGGLRVRAEDADEIARFLATDTGQRWCALQEAAFAAAMERFSSLLTEAADRGFVDAGPPLLLPGWGSDKK